MVKEYITISEQKLQALTSVIKSEYEKPILATPVEFKNDQNSFQSGIILATYGAIYVFKAKVFGSADLFEEIHLLNCHQISVTAESTIEMLFNEYFFIFRAKDFKEIAATIYSIWNEITFGINDSKHLALFNSEVELPDCSCTERPCELLKKRALFFVHFYHFRTKHLQAVDYFMKYENKPGKMLVLGPHFRPGSISTALGHSIGWDCGIKTVTFQSFLSTKFNELLDSIFHNAQTINRIAFTDYKKTRIPSFEIDKCTKKSSIRRFWFIRTCGKIINDLMYASDNFPDNMEELVIGSCIMRPQEFGDIVTSISESGPASNLKYICLIRVVMKPFPYDDFTRLVNITTNLQSITFRSLDIDASHLLRAICISNTHLRALGLTRVQFRTDIPSGLEIPPSLRMLNISYSAFSSSSFKSLIKFLTTKLIKRPIILQAQQLVLKQIAYQALSELDFDKMQPNLCEIDWSGNHIPKEPMRFFFAFLFTQVRCHLIMLDEITCGESTLFLSYLAQLAVSLPLIGLDVSGKFPSSVFLQFINSLQKVPELRRLKLSCQNAGDDGLKAFAELIPKLPNLKEILADGFKPHTPQPFFLLWDVISKQENIVSCDIPSDDLYSLGISLQRLPPEVNKIFHSVMRKLRPTTVDKRLQYFISQAEAEENEYEYAEEEEEEEEKDASSEHKNCCEEEQKVTEEQHLQKTTAKEEEEENNDEEEEMKYEEDKYDSFVTFRRRRRKVRKDGAPSKPIELSPNLNVFDEILGMNIDNSTNSPECMYVTPEKKPQREDEDDDDELKC